MLCPVGSEVTGVESLKLSCASAEGLRDSELGCRLQPRHKHFAQDSFRFILQPRWGFEASFKSVTTNPGEPRRTQENPAFNLTLNRKTNDEKETGKANK